MVYVLIWSGVIAYRIILDVFWAGSFGAETNKVTADLLYKGSALLLVVCMLPVVARSFKGLEI